MGAHHVDPPEPKTYGLDTGCRCSECAEIHAEFIQEFDFWPSMTHAEGQELKERRADNERSWERVSRMELEDKPNPRPNRI